ncbi:5-(carboxyamino)imidazole ribonucleotide synthase [Shimia ponticola]|uniref:5-(carboxyamino)imidazole ribonucleotide synthase n=1 Tax=Shimia ponticola TaxID=2582893 RepID=UPI0011BEAE3C|nr:5-(carboxyamino)imidazole ribonucleotide synthase [Shimia ponticola]
MTKPLAPGATIGILGGGQLGRMLALAAARLGLKCHTYDPAVDAPAAQVSDAHTAAPYDDIAALTAFAQGCAVVTYEFENIPTAALDAIEGACPIHPGRKALATSQDRLTEKEFLSGLGLHVAPYADITSADDIRTAMADMGTAGILKTRRFGYDGKGQVRLKTADEAEEAFAQLNGAPAILEGMVPLMSEISVIAARATDGAVAAFDPGENVHKDGILDTTTVPANVPNRLKSDAVLTAGRILNALDYVGVIGVEFFVTPSGLVVNEIAPRVHNSGHWTQNGCAIDQFEQHIRAIAGWPLGDGSRHSNVRMENLIGDDIDRVPDLAAKGAALHLYGKAEARPGRKMAHVNFITGPAG